MSDVITPTEVLFERIENYSKTSFELFRLNAIDKTAEITSVLAANIIIIFFVSVFFLIMTFAISFWIGEILGKNYYGFFVTSGFYGIVALLLYIFKSECLKEPIGNYMINQLTRSNRNN